MGILFATPWTRLSFPMQAAGGCMLRANGLAKLIMLPSAVPGYGPAAV